MTASMHDSDASRDPFQAVLDAVQSHEQESQLPVAYCGGCSRRINEDSVEQGVIQFAAKLWHVDCFRCAECRRQVSTDRGDTLLLSDGHPICGECNYSCNICGLPITEEALMTGNESYHAACFTCRSCNSRIVDLVFAKTSHGIYCMKCHNERVARSRRHAEQKRNRARKERQLQDSLATGAKTSPQQPISPSVDSSMPHADTPPTVPAKDLTQEAKQASSDHAANLSPWTSGADAPVSRPSSAASRRPMHAPTPPNRDAPAKLAAPLRRPVLGSRCSASSIVSVNDHLASSQEAGASSLSPSPRKADFGSFSESRSAFPASPRSDSSLLQDQPSDALETMPKKILTGLSASQFSLGSNGNQELQSTPTRGQRSGSSTSLHPTIDATRSASIRRPFLPSSSSSRLSKAYSFYDPDVLKLMESLGHSASSDELRTGDPESSKGTTAVTSPDASKSPTPSPASPLPTGSLPNSPLPASSLSSIPLPASPALTGEEPTSPAPASTSNVDATLADDAGVQHAVDSSEAQTALHDGRRNTVRSLQSLSSKMRASMQRTKDGHVSMNLSLVEEVLADLDNTRQRMETLQFKYDRMRRASQQAAHGFSLASREFQQEVDARHEAETEMVKLKKQLAEQALKLASISHAEREKEHLEARSKDVKTSLRGMERSLAKLTVERDMTVAEVAELVSKQDVSAVVARNTSRSPETALTDSLKMRLDAVKERYRQDIDELALERDSLLIEIEELKQSKELLVEEALIIGNKNDDLNAMLLQLKQNVAVAAQSRDLLPSVPHLNKELPAKLGGQTYYGESERPSLSSLDVLPSSVAHESASLDSVAIQRTAKPEKIEAAPVVKMFKWMKPKVSDVTKAPLGNPPVPSKANATGIPNGLARAASHDIVVREHLFQPYNVLRPARCLACQKNMWGQSEMRCALCTQICHSKCLQNLPLSCIQPYARPEELALESSGPSMFGRDLVEQAKHEGRDVPIIVDKCIEAVEASGMDYEGIYRKSGGTSQLKVIMQLFDRGSPFDLRDLDRFNDLSAVTSVLKNYFRELPNPLLTFDLYDDFINAVGSKQEPPAKAIHMAKLVSMLPRQHYCTLKNLILHLHRVQEGSAENRMTARNLGVVFGPTLMRSNDPTQEFAHMGGKAMTIEYFIDHALELFD